ncbi:hypothetical protein J7L05_05395 [bacterium]|nr:hypothetical protein [bacterium]
MKLVTRILLGIFIVMMMTCPLMAANTDNHDVTVTVSAINELAVSGNITITIDSATAGQPPNTETDATSTLSYTTNSSTNKKITGQYTVTNGEVGLTLEATVTSTSGTSAGKVTLIAASATDVITALIQCNDADETLTYDATATSSAVLGDHVYTVTYTLTDQ